MTNQQKLKKLVKALVSEHSESAIMFELYEQINKQGNGFMSDFNQAQAFNLNCEGYVVVKADTQKEQMQITDLLQTIIVSQNDQQAKLFC
jgi:hypothetical protein